MDDDVANPNRRPPKTSLFPGCFGFSVKRSNKSTNVSDNRRWFSRSTFLFKQSAGTKTVPLNSTFSDHKLRHKNNNSMFIKFKKKYAADEHLRPQTQAAGVIKSPHYKTRQGPKNKEIIENCKARIDYHLTNESLRNTSSQPCSPNSNLIIIPRSISFSVNHKTHVGKINSPKQSRNNLDPLVGMSIIMAILVILMIWGRICAILCTCSWLYFVPWLKKSKQSLDQTSSDLIFNEPEEYMKKRVVLEGFLDRNHNLNRSFM